MLRYQLKSMRSLARTRLRSIGVLAVTTFLLAVAPTQNLHADWVSFRNGGASNAAGKLPLTWSSEQGVAWQCELAGYGQSTPVILGDYVYLTAVEGPMKEKLLVLCYAIDTGKLVWKFEQAASNQTASNYMASRAAPTPLVDQKAVYAFFESGDLVAVDHDGQLLWKRELTADYGKFDNNHGLGSSPAQTTDRLFLNVEHRGPSYLLAVEKATGETAWKVERNSSSSWSSPVVAEVNSKEQVIVSSGGTVTSYLATDGAQLWQVDGIEGNSVPSPTVAGNQLLVGARLPEFASEDAMRSNCCLDLATIEDGSPSITWRASKAISDYASPVVCSGYVFFINKAGVLFCLDLKTGEVQYSRRIQIECWATPLVAGEHVYLFGKNGETLVVQGGSEFHEVARNTLWDGENPPRPETYVENNSRPEATESNEAGSENETSRRRGAGGRPSGDAGRRGGPGGGMMAALTAADKNNDGVLDADEIPADFKGMIARIDTNGDGSIDAEEMKAMAESFAARRAESQASARDPIVYGVAADNGRIIVRTGTRLYCIQ